MYFEGYFGVSLKEQFSVDVRYERVDQFAKYFNKGCVSEIDVYFVDIVQMLRKQLG